MLTSLVVAIAIVLHPGDVMTKHRVIRQKPASYGNGVNKLLDTVAPPAQQFASGVAYGAITDADNWWAAQGTRPKPIRLKMTTQGAPDGEHIGFGTYGTGDVQVNEQYIQKVTDILNDRTSPRHGKIEALAGLWALLAHERGHNLGYQHTGSGLMAGSGALEIPGEGYQWAKSMLPQKHKIRFRKKRG